MDFGTWKTICGLKIFIDWSYSLILLITLLISCVSPMHRKNINHMKHYVVMKEVHRIAPALASLLRRRKNRNFCTQWVQAVQCTAVMFCTYYSGPVCAISFFSTRFIQNYLKVCFATFETTLCKLVTHCKCFDHKDYRDWKLQGTCRENLHYLWKRSVSIAGFPRNSYRGCT